MTKDLHATLDEFKSYVGKHDRTLYPWLNGKTKGFPNRVKGFYDCALAVSYFTGLSPQIISCGVLMDYLKKLGTWKSAHALPQVGDAIIFGWSGNKQDHDHVGLVLSVTRPSKSAGEVFDVTYVSADSTQPCPGFVTVNTVSSKYVTGWGDLKLWAAPSATPSAAPDHAPVVPTADAAQTLAHAI
jgi:hypothetical protein